LGDDLVALPADARTREQLDCVAEEVAEEVGEAGRSRCGVPNSRRPSRGPCRRGRKSRGQADVEPVAAAKASQLPVHGFCAVAALIVSWHGGGMRDEQRTGSPAATSGVPVPAGHGHGAGHVHDEAGHDHDEAGHDHSHDHDHGGRPRRGGQWRRRLAHVTRPHSHEPAVHADPTLSASKEGVRALWISLAVLGATTVAQLVVVLVSGSVALLGDTVHNAGDALTALPLGAAFVLGRRPATRHYTYGFGRAEDVAGIVVLLVIAASAAFTGYEAVDRLAHPRDVSYLPAVVVAGLVGFAGNELVARYRIGVGRKIGSAALVADGLHARTDGFTSLAVVFGAAGVALGWQAADPVVGLLIMVAIVAVLRSAAAEVYHRLMDAVDPKLVEAAETALAAVPGVIEVGRVRMRWVGHRLHAETDVVVPGDLTVVEAHEIAVAAEHALLHAVPRLVAATVHVDHLGAATAEQAHEPLAHHASPARQS
jgi:cation diffusion facilitator family transporter